MKLRVALAGLFLFAVIHSAQNTREATLSVRIVDGATGRPTPVRIRLEDEHGVRPRTRGALAVSSTAIPIPRQSIAVMWGQQDTAQGYAVQPDGSFYVDGSFDVRVPPGAYTVTLTKGFEYKRRIEKLDLKPGSNTKREFKLERWSNLPAQGWYSADDHIHLHRSPADDANIARWVAAEDIHVGNILQMGDFWATFFAQYAFGEAGRYRDDGRILSPGQEEPRTPEIGHTISLGADQFVRMSRDYYSFDRLFDRVHQLNGVTGFAHQAMSFHGYRGMALNTVRGKTDFLELAQYCVPEGPLATEHYYRYLDLGYKITALAGSDFPWCGQGPEYGFQEPRFAQIGNARFYTYTGRTLDFAAWIAGLKAGHTFVTTGPMLMLRVNQSMPGDTLAVQAGAKVHISAEAFGEAGQAPLSGLEIVAHSQVISRAMPGNAAHLTVEMDLPIEHGIWIAARATAGTGQIAHTTPVYITTGPAGFRNEAALARNRQIVNGYLDEIERDLAAPDLRPLDTQASRHAEQLRRQIAEARALLR